MDNSFRFYKKYFKHINAIYLVLSIALLFLPIRMYIHNGDGRISFLYPFYLLAELNSTYKSWAILSWVFLVFYLLILISTILNCLLTLKKHKDFTSIVLLPLLAMFCFYNWFLFNPDTLAIQYSIPFIGYFLCLALMLYSLIIAIRSLVIKISSIHISRPHKPTKSELIAELERQIAELKSTQNSTDEEILP